MSEPYAGYGELGNIADQALAPERAEFITKTYAHLAGAVGACALLVTLLFQMPVETQLGLMKWMVGSQWAWLIVLGLFMVVASVAHKWAQSAVSVKTQYMGLGLYVVAEAVLLFPLIWFATHMGDPKVLPTAGVATLVLFAGLTLIVFMTKQDFSFLRSALMFGAFAAMGLIVCGIIFGFSLGVVFTVAMIALMCGFILYDTSNVLHHYRIGQHVAASLALFASVATLFWYVLQLVMYLSASSD